MMPQRHILLSKIRKYIFILMCNICSYYVYGRVSSSYYDPIPLMNPRGNNALYNSKIDRHSIDIMPVYHFAKSSRNNAGEKIPTGDLHGRWNMLALLHGTGAAPAGALTAPTTPALYSAASGSSPVSAGYQDSYFKDGNENFGYYSVPIRFQEAGVRGQMRFPLFGGFGILAQGGFVHYRQSPTFNDKTSSSGDDFSSDDKTKVTSNLMTEAKRLAIGEEIGLNFNAYQKTGFEDTIIELFWTYPFYMHDEQGNHAVSLIPYLSFGALLPTGEEKDQDFAFSRPLGHDGFYGVTMQADLVFDFPQTITCAFGGNITLLEEKEIASMRLPSSLTQQVIYPWKAKVLKKPGVSWNLHAGIASYNFVDSLSFFMNIFYAKHEKDSITMNDAPSRNVLFFPEKIEKDSEFESTQLHVGLSYKVTPNLLFAGAVELPLMSRKTYRATTVLGSLSFNF